MREREVLTIMLIVQTVEKTACKCGCGQIPPGTGVYFSRECQHKDTCNANRTRVREAARHKNCTVCGRPFIAGDIRWNRCDNKNCRVIPVVMSMVVSGSHPIPVVADGKITGAYSITWLRSGKYRVTLTIDGHPHEEYLTISANVARTLAGTLGEGILDYSGKFTITRQVNGDIRVSLALKGWDKLITFDIWNMHLPPAIRWPRDAEIREINFGTGMLRTNATPDDRSEKDSAFCGVDSEGQTRECFECDCGQFRPVNPDDSNCEVCKCGHKELSILTAHGKGHAHKPVLLGCGDRQIENINGLEWEEIFEFLYSCSLGADNAEDKISDRAEWENRFDRPGGRSSKIFVGYFLGYDFTMWLRTLPVYKAVKLITDEGIASRERKDKQGHNPVDIQGTRGIWYVHLHASKRLQIKPKICACPGTSCLAKCTCEGKCMEPDKHRPGNHRSAPWMYINDCGGFFQEAFANVINPKKWDVPVCSDKEYALVLTGKSRRSSAGLDDDMRLYNRLENMILARVMDRIRYGLESVDIKMRKSSWYGPGQAAQAWLNKIKAPKVENETRPRKYTVNTADDYAWLLENHRELWVIDNVFIADTVKLGDTVTYQEVVKPGLKEVVPAEFFNAGRMSYYGGWFEIMAHGIVPGMSYNYDINSAYPWVIASLPCLEHGKYVHHGAKLRANAERVASSDERISEGLPELSKGHYRLIFASVWGSNPHIGAMLWRDEDNSIMRPTSGRGWYWQHELEAAQKAGLIDRIQCEEWWTYEPCDCPSPFAEIVDLYYYRINVVSKKSAGGKATKLVANSAYGKLAQSIGQAIYANPVYASLITAGCRTRILEAIASHDRGANAVLMVATDGIAFDSPHRAIDEEIADYVTSNPVKPNGEPRETDDRLGHWEASTYEDLTLFKPGVYWHKGWENDGFKARGVSPRDFAKEIEGINEQFRAWNGVMPEDKTDWPKCEFRLGFSMVSCKQALQFVKHNLAARDKAIEAKKKSNQTGNRNAEILTLAARVKEGEYKYWWTAGKICEVTVEHTSWPGQKRAFIVNNGIIDVIAGSRQPGQYQDGVYRSQPIQHPDKADGLPQAFKAYNKAFSLKQMYQSGELDLESYGLTPDGLVNDAWLTAIGVRG